MEQWRKLENYDNYEVSTEGRVRNSSTGRILKTNIDKKGYEQICLRKDNRTTTERVHKLVGATFLEPDEERKNVMHKNNIRNDNRVENLMYATRSELDRMAFDRGTRKPVRQSRVRVVETGEEFASIRECGRVLGLSQSDICKCVNGVAYTCGGYHFEKVE